MATQKVYVDLLLNGNEIKDVRVDNVLALPAGVPGQIVYLTTDNTFYYFNGTTWVAGADVSIISTTTALVVSEGPDSTFTLSISDANATDAGLLSAAFWALLDGATSINTPSTLVKRDAIDGGFAAGTIDVSGHDPASSGVTGLSTPIAGTDAANKDYVDAIAAGLYWKAPGTLVNASGALALTGLGMLVDGVAVTAGMIILAADQGATGGPAPHINNGYYVAAAGAWTRWSVYDTGLSVGSFASFIQRGSTYGDSAWVCTNDSGSDVVGTDALGFVIFSSPGSYNAGNGIFQSGNTFSIVSAANTLTPTPGNLEVKVAPDGAITQGTGTGIAAKVDSSTIPTTRIVANEIVAGAAMAKMVKKVVTIGTGAGPQDITHNLGTRDVQVAVYDVANDLITVAVKATSINIVTVAANGPNQSVTVVITAATAHIL